MGLRLMNESLQRAGKYRQEDKDTRLLQHYQFNEPVAPKTVALTYRYSRYISEIFRVLPDKDAYADYYQLIPEPEALDDLAVSVLDQSYTSRLFKLKS